MAKFKPKNLGGVAIEGAGDLNGVYQSADILTHEHALGVEGNASVLVLLHYDFDFERTMEVFSDELIQCLFESRKLRIEV